MPIVGRIWPAIAFGCGLAVLAGLVPFRAVAAEPLAPLVTGAAPENEADIVRLPDGTLKVFFNQRNEYVGSLTSRDHGRTWSEPRKEFDVSGKTAHAIQVLLDRRGELQVFYLVIVGSGRKLGVDLFLDLWQCTTSDARRRWNEPRLTYHGAVGALRGLVQMTNGRIVIPFSTASADRVAGPPIGYFYTTAIVSDDDGHTWRPSPAQLTSPCHEGYNGGNYGAVEPTIVQLNDGRLWMLIRTQTGRMYESFSPDGLEWTAAAPSRFYGSNSPAMFRRLDDGRLLLVWNNGQVQPRHEGQGVYGGRDALHAALSGDDGRTWRGFREVYRDPTRHGTSELRNDRGTAYPDAVQAADGAIVLVTGQGEGRRTILRFSADWLLATHAADDFSHGLENWIAFQEIGPAMRFWRDRRLGGQLIPHPQRADAQVLSIGRRDSEPGAGAVWNFPAGQRGALSVRVRSTDGFGGASLALANRLFHPADDAARREAAFAVDIGPDGKLGAATLSPNTWHDVRLAWDIGAKKCIVSIDGRDAATLPLGDPQAAALSYLAVRSTAERVDTRGLLIERVSVDIEP